MKLLQKPKYFDVICLSFFTILITLHPYYLRGEINLYELGIYLPGINSILDGGIPFRDFFHLRGPLELYIPAFFMMLFGENVSVLITYFYVGTVLTLIIGLLIARELYKTRLVLYLLIPILIARTFPRVVFTNWGGLRYGMGLLALLFLIYFYKREKYSRLFMSGIVSSLALLMSVEVGVCAIFGIGISIIFKFCVDRRVRAAALKPAKVYILGLAAVLLPYGTYLFFTQSLGAYLSTTYSVVTTMTKVFPDYLLGGNSQSLTEILHGMIPSGQLFQYLTPVYCYLILTIYLIFRVRKRKCDNIDFGLVGIAGYGLIMYVSAFRKIQAAQFEMALQPEKILFFFILEIVFIYFWAKRAALVAMIKEASPVSLRGERKLDEAIPKQRLLYLLKIHGIDFLILAFIMSSLGYSIARYNRRFFAFKYVKNLISGRSNESLIPLKSDEAEVMNLKRVRGLVVPHRQAEDFKQLTRFIQENTALKEPVFMFPELGAYSFIVDRPFVGRFPMATYSWMGEEGHEELLKDLKAAKPRFAVLSKDPGEAFPKAYFKIQRNKDCYDEIMNYIADGYRLAYSTESLLIYARKLRPYYRIKLTK